MLSERVADGGERKASRAISETPIGEVRTIDRGNWAKRLGGGGVPICSGFQQRRMHHQFSLTSTRNSDYSYCLYDRRLLPLSYLLSVTPSSPPVSAVFIIIHRPYPSPNDLLPRRESFVAENKANRHSPL